MYQLAAFSAWGIVLLSVYVELESPKWSLFFTVSPSPSSSGVPQVLARNAKTLSLSSFVVQKLSHPHPLGFDETNPVSQKQSTRSRPGGHSYCAE
jgi:hypothetical protein